MQRLVLFLKDLKRESKRINWPTRSEAIRTSVIVIAISLIVAVFLGSLDFLFVFIIEKLIA